jgi:hypothetical protein
MLSERAFSHGERRQKVRQFGVGAVRKNEPTNVMTPVPAAPLARDCQRRLGNSDRVSGPSRGMVEEDENSPRASLSTSLRITSL